MQDRSEEFWSGSYVTAFTLADEDMFLLKAVSGGDIASGRRRDIEDMRKYAQRGLNYELILSEIDEQRPFNTGMTEARQIRDRSHPLFTIEMAVNSLSGFRIRSPPVSKHSRRSLRSNMPFWALLTMGLTTSARFVKGPSRLFRCFRMVSKMPSMKPLTDSLQSRSSSGKVTRFDIAEQGGDFEPRPARFWCSIAGADYGPK